MSTSSDQGQADPLIGTVIGERYRVLGLVGKGSMGAVYEVEQLDTGRRAAMKTLASQGAQERELSARLVREAKAMSLFEHRNIVELIDVIRTDDAVFVVTELVRGMSLREVMDDGQVAPRRALSIMRQVLEALEHAHARGVVHRDVKPENIMLVDGGHPDRDADLVKMLDFGVAKLLDDTRALLGEDKLTRTGHEVFGSPLYVAPEPVLGRPVQPRSDLYSAGAVLFELLSGQPPFYDPDPMALLRLQATAKAPTLGERAPDRRFTPEIEYVVAEALAKKPELRFASATDMIAAIDVALRSLDPASARSGAMGARIAPAPEPLAGPALPGLPPAASAGPGLPGFPPMPGAAPGLPGLPPVPGAAPGLPGLPLVPPASPAPPGGPMAPVAAGSAPARGDAQTARSRRRALWALGGTIAAVIVIATVAALVRGDGKPDPGKPTGSAGAAGSARAGAPGKDPKAWVAAADDSARRGRHLEAVGALERAIKLEPELGGDPQIRSKISKVLETRDLAAAMVALELLSRVVPPARDAIAAQAAAAQAREIRWRALAIAERDGFADQIDRFESWSKDLRQATTCDDRRGVIARLRALGDRRAIPALQRARDTFACVKRDASEAIAELEAKP